MSLGKIVPLRVTKLPLMEIHCQCSKRTHQRLTNDLHFVAELIFGTKIKIIVLLQCFTFTLITRHVYFRALSSSKLLSIFKTNYKCVHFCVILDTQSFVCSTKEGAAHQLRMHLQCLFFCLFLFTDCLNCNSMQDGEELSIHFGLRQSAF